MNEQEKHLPVSGLRPVASTHKPKQSAKQTGQPQFFLPGPTTDDQKGWLEYWKALDQPWRTEPEIEIARQEELQSCLAIAPNISAGAYPFKGMALSRADVEWLLSRPESERGPEHKGLDLRGADLRHQDLSYLPLACLRGSLTLRQWSTATPDQRKMAVALMEGVNLYKAQLERATLNEVHLEKADLREANLKHADLRGAHLESADLREAQLESTDLREAHLKKADLRKAYLEGTRIDSAYLERANLNDASLKGISFMGAQLLRSSFIGAHLESINFYKVRLYEINFTRAQLAQINLSETHLEGVKFSRAHLERVDFGRAHLERIDFGSAYLQGVNLEDAALSDRNSIGPQLIDAHWSNTNLAVVDWSQVKQLGDEYIARQRKKNAGNKKDKTLILSEYKGAVRANRQLAVALQAQGLNEEAARFAYRAQTLQRLVLQQQRKIGQYLFYCFLATIAGYGYKPIRGLIAYLVVILGCATTYYGIGQIQGPSLSFLGAIVFSVSSFHGRGFFPGLPTTGATGVLPLDHPMIVLAAAEAIIGLMIELCFIATFTQRFLGK